MQRFLLTENCENIQEYFDLNKEISVFDNIDEAKEKIKFFDKNPSLTKKIAEEAYIRVINNHTYEKRFLEIFKKLGMSEISFSVLLPVYRKVLPKLFKKSLDSILNQSLLPNELIVIFDGQFI